MFLHVSLVLDWLKMIFIDLWITQTKNLIFINFFNKNCAYNSDVLGWILFYISNASKKADSKKKIRYEINFQCPSPLRTQMNFQWVRMLFLVVDYQGRMAQTSTKLVLPFIFRNLTNPSPKKTTPPAALKKILFSFLFSVSLFLFCAEKRG